VQITDHWCYGRLWDPSEDRDAVLADWWCSDVKCNPSFAVDCGNSVRSEFHPEDLPCFFVPIAEAG